MPIRHVVLDSLAHPWSIAFINKDNALITEKDGDLLKVDLVSKKKVQVKGFPKDLFVPHKIDVSLYPPRTCPTSVD